MKKWLTTGIALLYGLTLVAIAWAFYSYDRYNGFEFQLVQARASSVTGKVQFTPVPMTYLERMETYCLADSGGLVFQVRREKRQWNFCVITATQSAQR